ncbi:MAG TPA: hypothetical protein DDW52_14020, partial [Planctomycetaceae bacterium]|nr:hypothetical protein [Planctomycetaceae bacterium]
MLRKIFATLDGILRAEQPDETGSLGQSDEEIDAVMLEERILYSASPVPIDLAPIDDVNAGGIEAISLEDWTKSANTESNSDLASDSGSGSSTAAGNGGAEPAEATSEQQHTSESSTAIYDPDVGVPSFDPARSIEVIFVDGAVEGSDTLIDNLRQGDTSTQWLIVRVGSDQDGIEQVTSVLGQLTGVDAVHLVSHGDGSGIQLGNVKLNVASSLQRAGDIASWGHALDADADLLVYGCNLASTEEGQELINMLAIACDCDVAASDDETGHEDLGGDWLLEYTVGDVETDVAFGFAAQASWDDTLATITVTTTDDENDGDTSSITALESSVGGTGISLREAIIAANNTAGADTIVLGAGTYVLDIAGLGEDGSATGDLDINTEITIQGASTSTTIIDAAAYSDRIMEVRSSGVLSISDLTLTGANTTAHGGAIYVSSGRSLSATDVVFNNNTSSNDGGHIMSLGTTALTRVAMVGGSADLGGAMRVSGGITTLTNVTVSGNSAGGSDGGGGIYVTSGTLNLVHTTIADNSASTGSGGGVNITGGGLNMSYSIVADNTASSGGNDLNGNFITGGYNIIEHNSGFTGAGGTDIVGSDPGLGALSTVDGTHVHTFGASSIAYNAATGSTESTDQTNSVRDANGDIGAYELAFHSGRLFFTTNSDVSGSGTSGITNWQNAQVLEFGASPTFEPGGTSGIISSDFNLNDYSSDDAELNAMHFVSENLSVGDFNLLRGDIVFSTAHDETISGMSVADEDILVFRPASAGDWSSGSLFLLLDSSDFGINADVQALSIVETAMTVGGQILNVGDLLIANDQEDVTHVEVTSTGTNSNATTSLFLDASDLGINTGNRTVGIHLVSRATRVGDSTLAAGSLLMTQTGTDDFGGLTGIQPQDVVVWTISASGANSAGTAAAWMDGSDIGLDTSDEEIHSVAIYATESAEVNRWATAVDDSFNTTPAGTTVNVLANDNDPDSDGSAIQVIDYTDVGNGTLTDNGGGSFTYTPTGGFIGNDSFEYLIDDGQTGLSSFYGLAGDGSDAVSGNDATSMTGTTTVAGSFGDALLFDEVDDHLVIPDFEYKNQFTVSFDFKVDDNSGSFFQYIYSHGTVTTNNSLNIYLNETGITDPNFLRTNFADTDDTVNATALDFDASAFIGSGQWHTYTLTVDTTNGARVYVDGVLQAFDASLGGDNFNPGTDLYLGGRNDLEANRMFGGALDSVRIYNRALDSTEVSSLAGIASQSATVTFNVQNAPQTYVVTNTNDSGAGSLRQAIIDANANANALDTIEFNIAGSGVQTIVLASALPNVTDEIFIDGTTQTGYAGTPQIEIDASGAAGATAVLNLRTSNSTIQGLSVYGSVDEGLEIDGSTGFGDNNTIIGNWVGVKADGTVVGNAGDGVLVSDNALNNQIGGVGTNEGNVIAGSAGAGVEVRWAASTGNTIRGNRIYSNAELGVDLNNDGVTPNDAGDADTGTNNLQNWAVLTAASVNDAGTMSVSFDTNDLASGTYTYDFYASTDRDGGQVEGARYLFSRTLPGGSTTYNLNQAGVTLAVGEYVTLVTTDSSGNSSEFSNYAVVTDSDSGGASPSDLQVTSTNTGGLNLNNDGGNNAYLQADESPFNGNDEITIEVEFSTDSPAAGMTTLFSYADDNSQDELYLGIDTDGEIYLRVSEDGGVGYGSITNAPQLFDGEKHTVTVTWDNTGGILMFYVDGEQLGLGRNSYQTGSTVGSGGTVVIGQHQTSPGSGFIASDTFEGTIHSVRVFNDLRTEGEIAANWQTELPHHEQGMIAQWIFDDLSSEGVVTESVSGNNLTVKHTSESGFTASDSTLTVSVEENAIDGTVVGAVSGTDAEREAQIATLLAADPELIYSAETGKFYKAVASSTGWDVASTNAQSTALNGVNGQLGTIRSATEQEIVSGLAASMGAELWLGGVDETVEGEWRWIAEGAEADMFWSGDENGYSFDSAYNNWQSGRPDNYNGTQHYLYIKPDGEWNDEAISDAGRGGYVVEWDVDAVLDATEALSYTIASQTVAGAFAIDGSTGVISVADGTLLDYETNATHTITVRATDIDGNTYDEAFTVAVDDRVDANSSPTDLSSGIELNTDGGNDAYLKTDNGNALFGNAEALTYEVSFATSAANSQTLLSYRSPSDASDADDALRLQLQNNGKIRLTVNGSWMQTTDDFSYLRDGQRHSIGVSWDNTNGSVSFYVDGEFKETLSGLAAGESIRTGGTFVIGNEQDSIEGGFNTDAVLEGTVYDVRVWNDVRSDAEISLHYQQKFDSGSLPDGLVANWQMDGFNGSNQVVDVVSGNNLSIGHATGTGFTASTPLGDLHVSENALDGAHVGFVVPSDPDVSNDVVSDGRFLDASDPGSFSSHSSGETIGDWTVAEGQVVLAGSVWESTPLGGRSIELAASVNGTISQDITTVAGRQYQIVFVESGDWNSDSSLGYRVSAAGMSQDFYAEQQTDWSYTNMLWNQRSMTFTAEDSTTTLAFQGLESSSSAAVIGDVRVIEIPASVTAILNDDTTLSYDAAVGKFYRHVDSPTDFNTALTNATTST